MTEWIVEMERLSDRLAPAVLVIPGLVLLGSGLAVWLGGTLGRRLTVAVTAAVGAAGLAALVTGPTGGWIGAGVMGLLALLVPRMVCGLWLALWLVLAVMVVHGAVVPAAEPTSRVATVEPSRGGTGGPAVGDHLRSLGPLGWRQLRQAGPALWALLAAMVVLSGTLMALLPRLGEVLYASVTGTVWVSLGLVLLLLQKGSRPLSLGYRHGRSVVLAWGGMVLLGGLIQAICLLPGRRGDRPAGDRRGRREGNRGEDRR